MKEPLFVKKEDVLNTFDGIAHDLLEASRAAGEKQDRVHMNDLADAIFHHLKFERPVEADDIHHVFAQIKKIIRISYVRGRGQYVYL